MVGYQWDWGGWRTHEKVQGMRHRNGSYKMTGVFKSSIGNGEAINLYVLPMAKVGECWWERGCKAERNKGEKKIKQL